ncbi:MAG: CopG family antitoxin [Thermodesulfobacteriota bacterium]
MSKERIPNTDSIEELARFWDTHDVTDFAEELEEAREPVFSRERDTAITIHLGPEEADAVERLARSRGLAQATLIKEWVQERIHHDAAGTGNQ